MALLLLQLLPLLAVLLPGVSAAGLPVPMPPQHAPPRLEDNTIPMPAPLSLDTLHDMAVEKAAAEFLKQVWEFIVLALKAHRRQARSAEAASRTPTSPSLGALHDPVPHDMSDEDFAAEIIKMVWEFIWRSNQQQSDGTEAANLPPLPPSLSLSSPRPMPTPPSHGVPHDALPHDMSDEDFLAELIKMVWEFMWREYQAHQRRARSAEGTSPTPAPPRSTPASPSHMPAPPSPGVSQSMSAKDIATEITTILWEFYWRESQTQVQAHRRWVRSTEVDSSASTVTELRQLLQQLQNLPKKALVSEFAKLVRGSVNGSNQEAVIVGVEEALKDLGRHLRDQQEPPVHNRAKRNFTTSRSVDVALVSGLLVMSAAVVIIGNLDPVMTN